MEYLLLLCRGIATAGLEAGGGGEGSTLVAMQLPRWAAHTHGGDFDRMVCTQNPQLLSRFISESGRILPRKVTGVSAKQQRKLATAIKTARQMGILPYDRKHPRYADETCKPKFMPQF